MPLSTIVKNLIKRLEGSRQRQRDLKALKGLNAHMLKDIGLRYEGSEIVSMFDPFPSGKESYLASSKSSIGPVMATRIATEKQQEVKNSRGGEGLQKSISVCRYCGENLA
ncbi:DUF1127 domain-containing protein [Salinicola halimionae]|uniref:DUF1127 domain-containing protein n=1 Tax=Salinicola halimionae TaxID=1949081 RepID=UPI000DA1AC6D|nr:DUF1127 domain-containing protein [Salinicola halimionae]